MGGMFPVRIRFQDVLCAGRGAPKVGGEEPVCRDEEKACFGGEPTLGFLSTM